MALHRVFIEQFIAERGIEYGLQIVTLFFFNFSDCLYIKNPANSCKVTKTLFDDYDFAREYSFRNKKIGILSLGDPESAQDERLDELVNKNCNVIVCASRSKGATCVAVSSKLKPGDNLYWISPLYEYDHSLSSPLQADMQEFNAQFIVKYILSIL